MPAAVPLQCFVQLTDGVLAAWPAVQARIATRRTLAAAFLTMLTYTSPFVFASPVSLDAASEISSATDVAASDAAVHHHAAVSQLNAMANIANCKCYISVGYTCNYIQQDSLGQGNALQQNGACSFCRALHCSQDS